MANNNTIKYEIRALYCDNSLYGFWKDDKEMSVPISKIEKYKAETFINILMT